MTPFTIFLSRYALFFVALSLNFLISTPAFSQSLERWKLETLVGLQELQGKAECFRSGPPKHIHILGATTNELFFDDAARVSILGDLSALFASRTRARVTKADSFQFIATSGSTQSGRSTTELKGLIERASSADITVLLRPYRNAGASVDTEIILWARDSDEPGDSLQCVQSINVSIKTRNEDPGCAPAFRAARNHGTLERLRAYRDFFPKCPQVKEATGLIQSLEVAEKAREKQERCDRNFARAKAENTAGALTRFLEDNPDCPGRQIVMSLRDALTSVDRCRDRYNEATRINTEYSLKTFIEANRECAQTDAARELLKNLRVQKQLPSPPSQQSQPQVGTGGTANVQQPPVQRRINVSPSFDCRLASNRTENAICSNNQLATLDQEMARLYSSRRSRMNRSARRALLSRQRAWLRQRGNCGGDVFCLQQSYEYRIQELSW